MTLSVVIITHNEEANIGRTLESVMPLVRDGKGEIIVVDSGSTDRTVEIAKSFGAKVFVEEWKGFAAQKNSAIDKATGDWILSLDADEELTNELRKALDLALAFMREKTLPNSDGEWLHNLVGIRDPAATVGFRIWRRNFFLGKPLRWGGYFPDSKLRLVRKELARFEPRLVHEDIAIPGEAVAVIWSPILHHSYPTLSDYIEHMNRYSSLGAEMIVAEGRVRFSFINIVLRPAFTFIYNYFFRLGFLDGREGLLLHLYHAVYVSWKYAKAWELSRKQQQ
ncbi:MAG: glycosyltransferase family 2 protein [Candidatus Sulfotelmatobacter sp.]